MRRFRTARRRLGTRALAASLVATMFWATGPVSADPADIFSIGAPAIGSAPPAAQPTNSGDASVSATGSLQYSYPITVPPGRQGMQPELALSYDSAGSIYGTVAAGWSLSGLPAITLDTSRGRLWTTQFLPPRPKAYKSGLAGDRPLIWVSEPRPDGTAAARAQNDPTYVRYQRDGVDGSFNWWRALSPDGTTYYFGGAPDGLSHFPGCTTISDEYAPIAQSTDSFGNVVDYYWEPGVDGECRISHIDWGKNAAAGIAHFASVTFTYTATPPTCAEVVVGSQSSYRSGTKIVTGASQLQSITAMVGTGTEYTRHYVLQYDAATMAESTTSATCYRQLDAIQESAWGTNVASVNLPAVNFSYGPATFAQAPVSAAIQWPAEVTTPIPWNTQEAVGESIRYSLGWGFRFNSSQWPTVEAMMVDVDGDGLLDRLINHPVKDDQGNIVSCQAAWERNRGPGQGFESVPTNPGPGEPTRLISLPTLKWHDPNTCGYTGGSHANEYRGDPIDGVETCSLNYQLTSYTNYVTGVVHGCPGQTGIEPCPSSGYCTTSNTDCNKQATTGATYLSYRWFDVDGDGKVDLVASPSTGSAYNITTRMGRDGCGAIFPPVEEPSVFGSAFPGQCPQDTYTSDASGRYTMCNGMYPWAIYINHGNGVFGNPSIPGTPDSIHYEPVPLESTSADSSLTAKPVGQYGGILDIDGDGFFDGVFRRAANLWGVYRTDLLGGATQAGVMGPNTDVGYGFPNGGDDFLTETQPSFVGDPISSQGLMDVNGDGFLDHWVGSGNFATAEFNDGVSFEPGSLSIYRPGNDGTSYVPPGCSNCVIPTGPNSTFIVRGHRYDSRRVIDADLDGRGDIVITDSETSPPATDVNQGAGFLATGRTLGYGPALNRQMVVTDLANNPAAGPGDPSYTWEIRSDMIDLDGDGIPEGVVFPSSSFADGTGNLTQMHVSHVPTPTQPPRLLVQIDAQRGAVTDIRYAAMSNTDVVVQHPEFGKASPQPRWVVHTITTTDNLPTTSATVSTTTYKYIDPHFGPDDRNKYAFRGFEEIDMTMPSGAKSVDKYSFDPDWAGRLVTSLVIPAEAPGEVRSIDDTSWETLTLFNGAITTFHAASTDHWTCKNGQDEDACRLNTDTHVHTRSTATAEASDSDPTELLYAETTSRLMASDVEADGDRQTDTTYTLISDDNTYRLLTRMVVGSSQVAGTLVPLSHVEHTFDSSNRVPETDVVWLTANGSDFAVTRRIYDMFTGNVLQRRKPNQEAHKPLPGPKLTYTYDSRRLFPIMQVDEAGLEIAFVHEYGTGITLETQGPNIASCSVANPPNCPAGSLSKQDSRIVIDALGRTLERWDTFSENGSSYTPYKVETFAYVDSLIPNTLTHEHAISGGYSLDVTELDGHGRPTRTTTSVFGSAPADQVSTYHYGNDGSLLSVSVPDPSANDGSTVTYTYTYDSLGRSTSTRRPDSSVAAEQSGVDIAYDGLTSTMSEVVNTNDGNAAVTTSRKDAFGRLVEVDEESASSPLSWATTTYGYDDADRVTSIVDPEQQTTVVKYDFAGRRSEIDRASGTWTFTYDYDGNVATTTSPNPCTPGDVVCEAPYVTSFAYDDLDRVTSKFPAPRDLRQEDIDLFGAQTETFTWDKDVTGEGGNYLGQLGSWQAFAEGTSDPTVEIDYEHDAQGHNYVTRSHFRAGDLPGTDPRDVTQLFNYDGTPDSIKYHDGDGLGGGETEAGFIYDARGLPASIALERSNQPVTMLAVQTRNVAGLVINRHTDITGSPTSPMTFIESNWTYDKLGRVASQVVQKGPGPTTVARQDLSYFGNDDPKTLDQYLESNHKQFAYGYDQRHQITSAVETTTTGYFSGSYAYGDAGRFAHAAEDTSAPDGSEVKPRDVDYRYSTTDPEQVEALVDAQSGDTFAAYRYDAAGNRIWSGCSDGDKNCDGTNFDYLYDGADRLRRVTRKIKDDIKSSEEYWYDGNDVRVAILKRDASGAPTELIRFVGPTEVHYDPDGNVKNVYSYIGMGTPVARTNRLDPSNATLEFTFQGLGSSTLAAVDRDTGTIDASFSYSPFGAIVESTDAGAATGAGVDDHRHRMNNKYVDEVSDLAYYGARYYDKTLIGWTQPDPLYRIAPDARWAEPRRGNLYAFTLNNPLRYVDPDGRDSFGTDQFFSHSAPNSLAALAEQSVGGGWGPFAGPGETVTTARRLWGFMNLASGGALGMAAWAADTGWATRSAEMLRLQGTRAHRIVAINYVFLGDGDHKELGNLWLADDLPSMSGRYSDLAQAGAVIDPRFANMDGAKARGVAALAGLAILGGEALLPWVLEGGAAGGADATAAKILIREGPAHTLIGFAQRWGGVAGATLAGLDAHENVAKRLGIFISEGIVEDGYAAVTFWKEDGTLFVYGSKNFGGLLQVPQWAIDVVKAMYH